MALCSNSDFYCSVCLEVFRDPVVLSCSHSFCKPCLQKWWAEKVTRDCPICKRRSSRDDPPSNLALKNLCEAFSQKLSLDQSSDDVCPKHGEKLRLFCNQHKQLVCLVCRDSSEHFKHSFKPVDEAAQDYKTRVKCFMNLLEMKNNLFTKVEHQWTLTAAQIAEQAKQTENLIREEFDKMRKFLQKEEEDRIHALKIELLEKTVLTNQALTHTKHGIQTMSETIRQTEKQLSQDLLILQNYNALEQRIDENLHSIFNIGLPHLQSLIDVPKHLGNLGFHVWCKMKELVTYTPVVLDPNTAHPRLTVSKDLCSFMCKTEPNETLPNNDERFKYFQAVLGSEGYTSGTHSWEVEVQSDEDWEIGVVTQSMPRKQENTLFGIWSIWKRDDIYSACSPPFIDFPLRLNQPLQKIRVDLDCNARTLSFSDPITNKRFITFPNISSEKLFPIIETISPKPFRILPMEISVQKCT